jgi:hypothetical protein
MPYSDWVESRRNLCTNPLGSTATATTGYGVANGSTMGFDSTTKGLRLTAPVSAIVDSGLNITSNFAYTVGAATYTVSMDLTGVVEDGWCISPQSTWVGGTRKSAYFTVAAGETRRISYTFTTVAGAPRGSLYILRKTPSIAGQVIVKNILIEQTAEALPYFDGSTPSTSSLSRCLWITSVNNQSIVQTRTFTQAPPTIPVKNLTNQDVLYGDRVTSYRWEVLEHANGVDRLVGVLDGVSDGKLSWTQNVAVKGRGKVEVLDLAEAQAGMLRVGDLKLESVRLRPVCIIQGLPENPLGVFLVSAAGEDWEETGRVWDLELLDKCTVPSQDSVDQSYAVGAGTKILQRVKAILASCNETITINESSTLATSSGMVWEAGTSKLKIINELLDVAGYNSLWVDGFGNFQVTPRVLPADRSIMYEVLGIRRELRDGAQSIYSPSWSRDRDSFEVPNRVIAVEAASGDEGSALIGTWTNEDPKSPYSYQSRGRWIPHVLDSVECPEGTNAEIVAFLQARARATLVQMSAVQATSTVEHLPIPVRVSDVIQFAHTKADIDSRHVITKLDLDANPLGLMKSTLQEVVSL